MRTATAPQPVYVNAPCTEQYEAMTDISGGKFCGSCQHLVHDFTAMSNPEIVAFLQARSGKVCGRFTSEQLGAPRRRWTSVIKVSVLAAVALWFSKSDAKAQTTQTETAPKTITVSDSVVLLVRGEVKSQGRTVWGATIEARDPAGNVIATARSSNGRFELHVPVAHPKQAFTVVVKAKGYRTERIENYVSAAGNVLGIDMTKRLFGKPQRGYHTIGCPSF